MQVKCWGANSYGQLGYGDYVQRGDNANEMGDYLGYVNLQGKNAVSVACGYHTTCVVLDDGTSRCWGLNAYGQLGIGSTAPTSNSQSSPIDLGTGTQTCPACIAGEYTSSPSSSATCTCSACPAGTYTLQEGSGACTQCPAGTYSGVIGSNSSTVCTTCSEGTYATAGSSSCIACPAGSYSAVFSATSSAVCATCAAGKYSLSPGASACASCAAGSYSTALGANSSSVCTSCIAGTYSSASASSSCTSCPVGTYSAAVGASSSTSCTSCQNLVTYSNTSGRTACNSCSQCEPGTVVQVPCNVTQNTVCGIPGTNILVNFTASGLTASGNRGNHICTILGSSSGLKCWGSNENGQLGYGDTNSRGDAPNEMGDSLQYVDLGSTSFRITSVTLGYLHTCAIIINSSSGSLLKCWGSNAYGQLGYGDSIDRGDNPNEMGALLPFVNLGTGGRTVKGVSAGSNFVCAILDVNLVKCWGDNFYGQLGLGDKTNRGTLSSHMGNNLPYVSLGTGRSVKDISCGGNSVCAILDNNGLKCWGYNKDGMLGLGSANSRGNNAGEMGDSLAYMQLGTAVFIRNVSLGRTHGCILTMNSNLVICLPLCIVVTNH
jgi:alpha-tubulin suppressor-like RCC1 family protein